jgi:hypothetical protein
MLVIDIDEPPGDFELIGEQLRDRKEMVRRLRNPDA